MSMDILSNLVLLSGVGALSLGYYLQTKQAYLSQLFSKIEKCQKFHLDYVDSPSNLPVEKSVLLFGTARGVTTSQEKVIARTFIKQTAEQDRLWRFHFKDRFAMATAGSELVQVQPNPQGGKILAINLHKKHQDGRHEERVIHHNEPVCAFGTLTKVGENGRRMYPQILMGSKQEQVLSFLDQQILRINQRGRAAIGVGSILLLSHLAYQILWGRKTTPSDNNARVLAQIESANK